LLLDILDKISYTILDVYFFIKSGHAPKTLAKLVASDPDFGSLWQSIFFKKGELHFTDPARLLRFLKIRAIMHDQLYKNPKCRKLELAYSRKIETLYQNELLTVEQLIRGDDNWLEQQLEPINHPTINDSIKHLHFRQKHLCDSYRQKLNGRFIFTEHIKNFSTGLNWPVKHQNLITPLSEVVDQHQSENLQRLSSHREGWHTFFYA